jgi:hypothetical protein
MTARPSGRKAQIVPVRSQPRLFLPTLADLSSANFQSVPIDQKSLQRINKISLVPTCISKRNNASSVAD